MTTTGIMTNADTIARKAKIEKAVAESMDKLRRHPFVTGAEAHKLTIETLGAL